MYVLILIFTMTSGEGPLTTNIPDLTYEQCINLSNELHGTDYIEDMDVMTQCIGQARIKS